MGRSLTYSVFICGRVVGCSIGAVVAGLKLTSGVENVAVGVGSRSDVCLGSAAKGEALAG